MLWHAIVWIAIAAFFSDWRPSKRAAGMMLAAPVASAGIFGFVYENPFNGFILTAAAIALLAAGARPGAPVPPTARRWEFFTGVVLVAFGWLYPHFLEGQSPIVYLYAAPLGLIPCPTLSLVIGFALIAGGLRHEAESLLLAALGIFYGFVGVLWLGVWIDLVLLLGASALVVSVVAHRLQRGGRPHRHPLDPVAH